MINDENQEILLGENRIYNNLKGKITFENENGYMQIISRQEKSVVKNTDMTKNIFVIFLML